jgi:hypothetical protein
MVFLLFLLLLTLHRRCGVIVVVVVVVVVVLHRRLSVLDLPFSSPLLHPTFSIFDPLCARHVDHHLLYSIYLLGVSVSKPGDTCSSQSIQVSDHDMQWRHLNGISCDFFTVDCVAVVVSTAHVPDMRQIVNRVSLGNAGLTSQPSVSPPVT